MVAFKLIFEKVFREMWALVQVGLQSCSEWEVRHGSMLGIKYLVAVRQVSTSMMFKCDVVLYYLNGN